MNHKKKKALELPGNNQPKFVNNDKATKQDHIPSW